MAFYEEMCLIRRYHLSSAVSLLRPAVLSFGWFREFLEHQAKKKGHHIWKRRV